VHVNIDIVYIDDFMYLIYITFITYHNQRNKLIIEIICRIKRYSNVIIVATSANLHKGNDMLYKDWMRSFTIEASCNY
jgi:hypothetical protein